MLLFEREVIEVTQGKSDIVDHKIKTEDLSRAKQ